MGLLKVTSDFSSLIEVDWLKKWQSNQPEKVALVDHDQKTQLTYNNLFLIAGSLAHQLKARGIQKGDRVGILSPNRLEMVLLFFAVQRLGALLVPINFRLSSSEVDYVLADSKPKILFYESSTLDRVQKLNEKVAELIDFDQEGAFDFSLPSPSFSENSFDGVMKSPCMILYTSGTTGFPKGAVLTNEMIFWNSINTTMSLDVAKDDVTICFSPLFHTGGWNVLMLPFLHRGGRVVLVQKFDPDVILELCELHQVTLLFGVPTTLAMMSQSKKFESSDLSSIRYMIVGGEAMPLGLIKTWHQRNLPIRQGYGLTEFGPNCFSLSEEDAERKIGSIGKPNFYVKTKIIDQDGTEVGVGEVGELLLSGPCCMKEYWGNPQATSESIREGWFYTGDLMKKDEEGDFFVVGRKKDLFISGGENVYPAEVERVLESHPMVKESAVIGVKDEKWGEVGQAFVVLRQEGQLSEQDLSVFCRDHLAGFKVPKHFKFLRDLPKGDTGKIFKRKLAESLTKEMRA